MTNTHEPADLLETVKSQLSFANSFSLLTAFCDGAFPASIVDVLRQLSSKISTASERLAEVGRHHPLRPFSDQRLPVPHPLDFEWRYSNASADELLRKLNAIAGPGGRLLFVCTPTVALRAVDAENSRDVIYASRADDAVTASLKEVCSDRMEFIEVRDDLSWIGAAAALVDPPWYDDIALPLVTQAVVGLEDGGGVLIGVPDRLTGCSSAPLLSSIDADSRPFGLEYAQLLAGKLRYETPYFELNTLHRLGLYSVHPRWRTGRVAFARKTRNSIPRYSFPESGMWSEIGGGASRMRFRVPTNGEFVSSGPFRFNVRETISRVPARSHSEVGWTAGNRVACALNGVQSVEPMDRKPLTTYELDQLEMNEIRELLSCRDESKIVLENVESRYPLMAPYI